MSAFHKESEATGAQIQDQLSSLENGLNYATDAIISSMAQISQDQIQAVERALTTAATQRELYKQMFTVLRSLRVPGLMDRKEHIPEAHLETLQWVFQKQPQFTRWLETEGSLFWISGVPGSGKSTLMKYLMDESRSGTQHYLEKWSGERRLVIASFYFWANGTSGQRSMEGLLRALLFQIFRQCPDIIHNIISTKDLMEMESYKEEYTWARSNLQATLFRIFHAYPDTRFCLFIDGLDEYEDASQSSSASRDAQAKGDRVSQSSFDIRDAIVKLSDQANVKLCISSRPWHVFESAFGKTKETRLDVEKFNEEDIRNYALDKLVNERLADLNEEQVSIAEEMANEVVRKSQGVFLWVALVVKSLIRGFTNWDDVNGLQKRLDKLPRDLDEYFERMLDQVEEIYQKDALEIIQIALLATERGLDGFCLLLYSFVGCEDPYFGLSETLPKATVYEDLETYEQALGRFRTRCPDVLYAEKDPQAAKNFYSAGTTVRFVHRTAVEYLKSKKAKSIMAQKGEIVLNPKTYIVNAQLKILQVHPGLELVHRGDWIRWILAHGDHQRDLQRKLLHTYCQVLSRFSGREISNFFTDTLEEKPRFLDIREYLYRDAKSVWLAEEAFPLEEFLPYQKMIAEMLVLSVDSSLLVLIDTESWSWMFRRGAQPNALMHFPKAAFRRVTDRRRKIPISLWRSLRVLDNDLEWTPWTLWLWSISTSSYHKNRQHNASHRARLVTEVFLAHDADPFCQSSTGRTGFLHRKCRVHETDDLAELFTNVFFPPEAESLIELLEQKRAEHRAREAELISSEETQSGEEVETQPGAENTPSGQGSSLWNRLQWLTGR